MSTIIYAIQNSYKIKKERGWDKTFWAFDIHGTIIKPNYSSDEIPTELYDDALETLRMISKDPEICMLLYTCSHPYEIEKYLMFFESLDIKFDYVNENPEVKTDLGGYGCYTKKPYFNVLLEDKAGFNPLKDWKLIQNYLKLKE